MKKLVPIFFIAVVLISCKAPKHSSDQSVQDSSIVQKISKDLDKYHLINRTDNCKQSLEFMRQLIEPEESKTKIFYNNGKFSPIGNINCRITGEKNPEKLPNLELFFVNLECLQQLKPLEFFRIFCITSDYEIIESEFSKKESKDRRYIFEISIDHMNCFSAIVENNSLTNMSWCIQRSIP